MKRALLLSPLLLTACVFGRGKEDTGDTQPADVEDEPEVQGCDVVEVGFAGDEPATVGQQWTVWPICDGDPVIGAMVIRVTPYELAHVDENVVTWEAAGTAEIMVQAGPDRAYLNVDVED